MRNRKGFTLIELLATVVILGVIMVVAIPNVVGIISKNRAVVYVEDAKKLLSATEYAVRNKEIAQLSTNSGERCAIFSLAYLDNGEFEKGPYGHKYDKSRSFVVAHLNGNKYDYYVRLLEEVKAPDEDGNGAEYRGISAAELSKLNTDNAIRYIEDFDSSVYVPSTAFDATLSIGDFTEKLLDDRIVDLTSACDTSILPSYRHTPDGITVDESGTVNEFNMYPVSTASTGEDFNLEWKVLSGTYGDISTNPTTGLKQTATFKVWIKNPNLSNISISITSSEPNLLIYKSGTTEPISGSINAQSTKTFDIDIKERTPDLFGDYYINVDLTLGAVGVSLAEEPPAQSIRLKVDYNPIPPDEDAPWVKATALTKSSTEGQATFTWQLVREDTGVDKYFIHVFDSSGNELTDKYAEKNRNVYQTTITGLASAHSTDSHKYSVVVCSKDTAEPANSATTNEMFNALGVDGGNGHCSSKTATFQWNYAVGSSTSNCSFSGNNYVPINGTYSATISANSGYQLPGEITVTMGGATLTRNIDYTYSGNSISISKRATGVINITASCPEIPQESSDSGCLVEGTEVLLKDGKTKKIEDVDYDDLVAVWNHDTGKIGYEYPIWLEKEHETTDYKVSTFSDGSTLKTTIDHAVFSLDDNEFISVNDKEKYKTGTRIAKIENGKIKEVTLTKVEERHEKVKYYQIISARYFNTITDGFLTSDYTVELPNAYGFEKNITWPKVREEYLSNTENYYKYEDFKDILPYYLFYGLARNGEGKILKEKYGIGLEEFRNYLLSEPLNEEMIKTVETNKNGKRMWMMTTSLDKVTRFNKSAFKYEEGSYYKLPNNKKVKYYKNSVDGKIYKPGEKVKVICGSYFEAIMKK